MATKVKEQKPEEMPVEVEQKPDVVQEEPKKSEQPKRAKILIRK